LNPLRSRWASTGTSHLSGSQPPTRTPIRPRHRRLRGQQPAGFHEEVRFHSCSSKFRVTFIVKPNPRQGCGTNGLGGEDGGAPRARQVKTEHAHQLEPVEASFHGLAKIALRLKDQSFGWHGRTGRDNRILRVARNPGAGHHGLRHARNKRMPAISSNTRACRTGRHPGATRSALPENVFVRPLLAQAFQVNRPA
jgi:hypothetical protein